VNDIDFEDAGRGIRVGLSLRGVDAEVLQKSHWLDDGSFTVGERLTLSLEKSLFYRSEVESRDLHIQLAGEMVGARFSAGEKTS
jgi:selenocysteine-specific translation elongation factor